jgi:hypothetical protein
MAYLLIECVRTYTSYVRARVLAHNVLMVFQCRFSIRLSCVLSSLLLPGEPFMASLHLLCDGWVFMYGFIFYHVYACDRASFSFSLLPFHTFLTLLKILQVTVKVYIY